MRPRSFAVIGLGTFGSTIATDLVGFGNPVLGIDIDERKASAMADTLTETIIADGRDDLALREAGVGNYDVAVVAIGEDLEANILCTMNVKLIGVPVIWVKALNRTHHRILARLGIDRVLLPEQEIGHHVAQVLHNPLLRDYVSLGNGYHVVDLTVPEHFDGLTVGTDIDIGKHDLHCLGAMRGTTFLPVEGPVGPQLTAGDKLLLIGKRADLRAFADDSRRGG